MRIPRSSSHCRSPDADKDTTHLEVVNQNHPSSPSSHTSEPTTWAERLWRGICRLAVRVFYRRVEVRGVEHIPSEGAVLLCANHANALVDVVLLQSASPRLLHPLARSGLFDNPALRPILELIQAVPIYRRVDGSDTSSNVDSFERCYELLAEGGVLVMFPEGVSHSAPSMQPLKTGAARIALGSALRGGPLPSIVPAGLTYVEKGRFRSRVLIQLGPAVSTTDVQAEIAEQSGATPQAELVETLTSRVDAAIRHLTLNVDRWEDLALMRQLERFFHFRRGRHPGSFSLGQRFRTFKRLIEAQRQLRAEAPDDLDRLRRNLQWFERLRRLYGIEDYHLRQRYRLGSVLRWALRNGPLFLLGLVPLLWALLTSAIPYYLVGSLTPRISERYDQRDTHKMVLGLLAFSTFWGAEIAFVVWRFGWKPGLGFAASLPIAGALALLAMRHRERILEQIRVFVLFARRQELHRYLLQRRQEIEGDLTILIRRARSSAATGNSI